MTTYGFFELFFVRNTKIRTFPPIYHPYNTIRALLGLNEYPRYIYTDYAKKKDGEPPKKPD